MPIVLSGGRVTASRDGGRGSERDGYGRERPTAKMRLFGIYLEGISATSYGR